jgi:hypothetical protein
MPGAPSVPQQQLRSTSPTFVGEDTRERTNTARADS